MPLLENPLVCMMCQNWIPIDREIAGYCYNKPLPNPKGREPLFRRTEPDHPCDDFNERDTEKEIDWPKHIYGAGSIIVPILLWVATHGGKFFLHHGDDIDELQFFPHDHNEIYSTLPNDQNGPKRIELDYRTRQFFQQTYIYSFFEFKLEFLTDIVEQQLEGRERYHLEFIPDGVQIVSNHVKHMNTDQLVKLEKNLSREVPEIEKCTRCFYVCNFVLRSVGPKSVSEWRTIFSEVEEFLRLRHGDNDSLNVLRA